MSATFDAYAAYYDLLNRDKDYRAEAAWIHDLIRRHAPDAGTMLELGCGTGAHAVQFARRGYGVVGTDVSEGMVARARARASDLEGSALAPEFLAADLRTLRLDRRFDVVVSLFHVMSYLVRNDDLQAAMETVAAHLKPGGVFIFDCWYGPAVLSDPPSTRVRRMQDGDVRVLRIAEPTHIPDQARVDVDFEILVERAGALTRIEECHRMRYLFTQEIDLLLAAAGLRRLAHHAWMRDALPDSGSWYACFVAGPGAGST